MEALQYNLLFRLPTAQPYAQLRQHLADRNAVGSSQPLAPSPLREFLLAVHKRLLPELKALASILEEAGIHCEVLQVRRTIRRSVFT